MKDKIKNIKGYFTLYEKILWLFSVTALLISFFSFEEKEVLFLFGGLLGVTSLIFCAKGNPLGQGLMIVFSILYAVISFKLKYFGEMITYLGMTGPMAALSLVSWLKNPFEKKKSQVRIKILSKGELLLSLLLSLLVSFVFYFILKYFHTARLFLSTASVFTSFLACFLTFKRSELFPLAYAFNDMILIVLWSIASMENKGYVIVLVCFCVFLFNDFYGFISWRKIRKNQQIN